MRASLRRIGAVMLRHVYLIRGSVTRIMPMFIWVAVDMILWGFLTRYLNGTGKGGFNFVPVFLGAVLLWDFLTRVMQGVAMAYMEDSWARNHLNVFSSPLSISEYLVGLVGTSIMTSLVGLIVMLLLADGVFGLHVAGYGLPLAPFMLILFLSGTALGLFSCSLMLRLGPAAEWFSWPLPAIISPFVGVFYPLAVLPGWMRVVSKALPPSYVFENVRRIAAGQPPVWHSLFIGIGLSAFYILLAGWFFARVHRYALRNGLISRFSAESF